MKVSVEENMPKMKKKAPRKPSQPLGAINFGTKGRPTEVIETLPDTQKDLEGVIVRKFIGAMNHFKHRILSLPTLGYEPADYSTREGDERIDIQVVEVLNPDHAKKRGDRDKCASRVRNLLDDCYSELAGLSITLHDYSAQPPYPPLTFQGGTHLARAFADNLRAAIPDLRQLIVGQMVFSRRQGGPTEPATSAAVFRFAPTDSGMPATLRFASIFSESEPQSLLTRAIEGKLNKQYPRSLNGHFWLLAYGTEPWLVEPKAIALAKLLLQSRQHPFDEVWSLFPYPDQDLGEIKKVWP
jgi:hypothetical protein